MPGAKFFNQRVIRGLFDLVAILLLASCAHQRMYTPPNLAIELIGLLEVKVPIWLVSIDGETVSSLSLHDSTFVKLLPGPHVVELAFQRRGKQSVMQDNVLQWQESRTYTEHPAKVRIFAQAGCKYVAEYKIEDDEKSKRKICKFRIVKLESA